MSKNHYNYTIVNFGPFSCPSAPEESFDYVLSNCIVRITLTGLILVCLILHCFLNCISWWLQDSERLNLRIKKGECRHVKLKNKAKQGKKIQNQVREQERLKRCRNSLQSEGSDDGDEFFKFTRDTQSSENVSVDPRVTLSERVNNSNLTALETYRSCSRSV